MERSFELVRLTAEAMHRFDASVEAAEQEYRDAYDGDPQWVVDDYPGATVDAHDLGDGTYAVVDVLTDSDWGSPQLGERDDPRALCDEWDIPYELVPGVDADILRQFPAVLGPDIPFVVVSRDRAGRTTGAAWHLVGDVIPQ